MLAHARISPAAPDSGAPDVVLDPTPAQDVLAADHPPNAATSGITAPAMPLNVLSVALGDRLIKPWYPSLYREELVGTAAVQRLHVCPCCFRYTIDGAAGLAHRVRRPTRHTHVHDASGIREASR